jgi:hypothetical protein
MATEARPLPDWGLEPTYPLARRVALVGINAGLWAAFIAYTYLLRGTPETSFDWIVFGMWVAFAIVVFARSFSGPGTIGFGRLKLEPLPAATAPRVISLAAGLAKDQGLQLPAIYLIKDSRPNAIVFRKWGPGIALTSSLVDTFNRTELEAVLAHCLARINSPHFRLALLASITVGGQGLGPPVGYADDVQAAALTKFPPGLASAIEKSKPVGKRYRPLWFVADGPPHRPVQERIAALQDL